MALSFTSGSVRTGITSHATERTLMLWINFPSSNGGITYPRIFDQSGGALSGIASLLTDTTGAFQNSIYFSAFFGGAEAQWRYARPASGAWAHLAFTYNNSSSANTPICYINGAAATLASSTTQSGAFSSNSAELLIGNRSGSDRTFPGSIAEFAQYNRILSADEVMACYKKGRPFQKDFVEHVPMIRDGRRMKSGPTAIYGTVNPQPHPRIYP